MLSLFIRMDNGKLVNVEVPYMATGRDLYNATDKLRLAMNGILILLDMTLADQGVSQESEFSIVDKDYIIKISDKNSLNISKKIWKEVIINYPINTKQDFIKWIRKNNLYGKSINITGNNRINDILLYNSSTCDCILEGSVLWHGIVWTHMSLWFGKCICGGKTMI